MLIYDHQVLMCKELLAGMQQYNDTVKSPVISVKLHREIHLFNTDHIQPHSSPIHVQ